MKKENVKVLIGSKKEAKDAARLLRVMGEKADKKYSEMGAFNSRYLIYDEPDNDWILLTTPNKEVNHEITIKQLVQLLAGEEEKPKEIVIEYSDSCKATITWDAVKFTRNGTSAWVMSKDDIQPIYDAWKSLQ